MNFPSEVFFDQWGNTEKGWGGGRALETGQHPITLEKVKSVPTMNLGDFMTHPKLFSSRSLSWSESVIFDFTTFLQSAKQPQKIFLLACVASVSVEQRFPQRAKNGVFGVLPARKIGREQK